MVMEAKLKSTWKEIRMSIKYAESCNMILLNVFLTESALRTPSALKPTSMLKASAGMPKVISLYC